MKKSVSLFLVLILCLSLCACGLSEEEGKYVGTYTYNRNSKFVTYQIKTLEATYSFVLDSDGTGNLTVKAEGSVSGHNPDTFHPYEIKKGDVLLEYELEWKVVDGYLVVDGTGKRYYTTNRSNTEIRDFGAEVIPITLSESYELKGNQLIRVADGQGWYTKED